MDRQKHPVQLSADQRQQLLELLRTGEGMAGTCTRAHILLLADRSQGHQRTDARAGEAVLYCERTVTTVGARFPRGIIATAAVRQPAAPFPDDPLLRREVQAAIDEYLAAFA